MPEAPSPQCVRRLQRELSAISKDPSPLCLTAPSSRSILVWYFVLHGPADTPYDGGRYVGRLNFPPTYPLRPPEISLLTPNGRFKTCMGICLSASNYHPEEWSPMWGVRTILTGLVSFMVGEEPTTGGLNCSVEERKELASKSRRYNVERIAVYKELFPEEYQKDLVFLGGEEASRCADEDDRRKNLCTGDAACEGMGCGSDVRWRPLAAAVVALFAIAVMVCFLRP